VCYKEILKIRAAIQSAWYPNIQAVAKNAFPSNPSLQSQWAAYAISCVQPGIDHFHKRLGDDQSNESIQGSKVLITLQDERDTANGNGH